MTIVTAPDGTRYRLADRPCRCDGQLRGGLVHDPADCDKADPLPTVPGWPLPNPPQYLAKDPPRGALRKGDVVVYRERGGNHDSFTVTAYTDHLRFMDRDAPFAGWLVRRLDPTEDIA